MIILYQLKCIQLQLVRPAQTGALSCVALHYIASQRMKIYFNFRGMLYLDIQKLVCLQHVIVIECL